MKLISFILFLSSAQAYTDQEVLDVLAKFGQNLKKELKKGFAQSPRAAVEACYLKAPVITQSSGKDGLLVGRVSRKNRNPNNEPDAWMMKPIHEFEKKKEKSGYKTVSIGKGKVGLIKPIVTMPLCLKCHGSNIDAEIQAIIKEKYPKDKAIGYKVGDIRGFFWAIYKR